MKPTIELTMRISVDECQKQRFTEIEVENEFNDDNVTISNNLVIRKSDGKVIGEFLIR